MFDPQSKRPWDICNYSVTCESTASGTVNQPRIGAVGMITVHVAYVLTIVGQQENSQHDVVEPGGRGSANLIAFSKFTSTSMDQVNYVEAQYNSSVTRRGRSMGRTGRQRRGEAEVHLYFHMQCTPTYFSSINQVGRWFAELTR